MDTTDIGLDSRPGQVQTQGSSARVQVSTAQEPMIHRELQGAEERLEQIKSKFFEAAVAFCDGSISAGQLRAYRQLLRDEEGRIDFLKQKLKKPEPPPPAPEPEKPTPDVEIFPDALKAFATSSAKVEARPATPQPMTAVAPVSSAAPTVPAKRLTDFQRKLAELDKKVMRLEDDFQRGQINASQYQAIKRHYLEMREVAQRLKAKNPESERWRAVLQEGRTSFLKQLNEAVCLGVGIYDIISRDRVYIYGNIHPAMEESMARAGSIGKTDLESPKWRMFKTQAMDGSTLVMIPGKYTVSLANFSQDPPDWQVRALREVHRNFEGANQASLDRGERRDLVFPNLGRIVKI